MRDISLQQTVTHMEVHEGHLSLPILSLLVLGGCCLCPLAPCFQPLEQTITTVTSNAFSHGMEHHHHSYTQCFSHGMEHHHHSYT